MAHTLAVLVSGGVDSCVLLEQMTKKYPVVFPLFVRQGLFWEPTELNYLHRFLLKIKTAALRSLVILEEPISDIYGRHWATTGEQVPAADSQDNAVYLPGRNLLLIHKPALWCAMNQVNTLALATLKHNPFPDNSPLFFSSLEQAIGIALGKNISILRPFSNHSKTDVLLEGKHLPLEETFSCIRPVRELHCGSCNKCAERKRAFKDALLADPTIYATSISQL
ncbi:MAG: 7-cyano-7-deazaguanine synthase [Deltaproteobacteria bacterium]|nr:7-cyano-7-deazaguanine synthase [Deltaproteobacteria bacterium]